MTGRFPIAEVSPSVQSGRRAAKGTIGEVIPIEATAFREGHDSLGVHVVVTAPSGRTHRYPMWASNPGLSRWRCEVWRPDETGDWAFTLEAFHDALDTWRHRAEVKIPAGIDVMLELREGAALFERAAEALEHHPDPALDLGPSAGYAVDLLRQSAAVLRDDRRPAGARLAVALAPDVTDLLTRSPLREHASSSGPWPVRVDRHRAGFGAWYELFPRSEGARPREGVSGTFAAAAQRLPAIADMGFDVVYLPPVHPIGRSHSNAA